MVVLTQSEKLMFGDIFEWAIQYKVFLRISAFTTHTNVGTGKQNNTKPGFKVSTLYFDHAKSITSGGGWISQEFTVHEAQEVWHKLSPMMHHFWDAEAEKEEIVEEAMKSDGNLEDLL